MMIHKIIRNLMKVNSFFLKTGTFLQTIFTADATGKMNHNNRNNTPFSTLQLTVPFPLFRSVWKNYDLDNIRYCNSSCCTYNYSDDKCYKKRFAALWAFIVHTLNAVNKNEIPNLLLFQAMHNIYTFYSTKISTLKYITVAPTYFGFR
jgi:hypothetical protein